MEPAAGHDSASPASTSPINKIFTRAQSYASLLSISHSLMRPRSNKLPYKNVHVECGFIGLSFHLIKAFYISQS